MKAWTSGDPETTLAKLTDEARAYFANELEDATPVGERRDGGAAGIEVEDLQGWALGVRAGLCDYLSLQPSVDDARALGEEREAQPG